MPDKYDPYREALVVEQVTIWPEGLPAVDAAMRRRVEEQLHARADQAANLVYVRLHTGFRREITVTPEDLQRMGGRE